jgi:hypothetical protein
MGKGTATMTLHETIDHAIRIVTKLFNDCKYIDTFCILIKDGREAYIPVKFSNDAQKEIISAGIKELVKISDPDTVVYASEAWARIVPKEEDLTNLIPPREHKDRVEIVMMQIEFRTGEKFGCSADIIRSELDTKLGEFKIYDAKHSMGRFVDFYPIKEKDKN